VRRPSTIAWLAIGQLVVSADVQAHEDKHTHAELTVAAVHFLDSPNVATEEQRRGWPPGRIAQLLRQGAIDEDKCPLYANHFYNPASPTQLLGAAPNVVDTNCSYYTDAPNYLPDPYYDDQNPDYDQRIAQQTSVQRAASNWTAAAERYRAGQYVEAFLLLGHVFHLMEDMTSPAHVHNDPHGKFRFQGGDQACSFQQDADDFENWGWCRADETSAAYEHVFDYVYPNGTTGADGTNIKDAARQGLDLIFGGEPQFAVRSAGENAGGAFTRLVAEVTFEFTTFEVKLRDEEVGSDTQPDSELKTMFGSLREAGNDAFGIVEEDQYQNVGYSDGHCERWEAGADISEEWWPMENSSRWPCTRTTWGIDNTLTLDGFAYIENSGGDGPDSGGTFDSLRPERYFKDMFVQRFGTTFPAAGMTQLRIYGDVLYPTAIAYGAGLLQSFIEEELDPPVADAGGPYVSDGCLPILFDASASHDRNPDGSIVSYSWDFNDDGTIDVTTVEPAVEYFYPAAYDGPVNLVVTDNDGFVGEATTHVTVDPDLEPPVIESIGASPNRLWPPNHRMVPIDVDVTATDRCGASCAIAGVTTSDRTGGGPRNDPDWRITGDLSVELRAERTGSGDGRRYTVVVECLDPAGNASYGRAFVDVPHDNGHGDSTGGVRKKNARAGSSRVR